ncbi:hypothetical protein [Roseomonas sp. AR75]|uniref:hypothetical protein n=1 Tax=Roseomonas sp. AR75 TaxID=2562311 RepID=UPI0010C1315F|nr:hypothetical protein [Roseomonas sp. AR75]
MPDRHEADGYRFSFVSRTSWKAKRLHRGQLIDVVPVTWTRAHRYAERRIEVWYRDPAELEARRRDPAPFVVAVAEAKDWSVFPLAFKQFNAVFEVAATGKQLSGISIEAQVLRRLRAGVTS